MASQDHGLPHSQKVWARAQEIIKVCPNLWAEAKKEIEHLCWESGLASGVINEEESALEILLWASVFHDLSRFLGADFEEHEAASAKLTLNFNLVPTCLEHLLFNAISHHDYLGLAIEGFLIPEAARSSLSEIFRLADKTSLSPAEELERYYQAGLRYQTPFFNPEITDAERLDFPHNAAKRDMLAWFLMLFFIQPRDFFFSETAEAYRHWFLDKNEAMNRLAAIARQEKDIFGRPIDPENIRAKMAQLIH